MSMRIDILRSVTPPSGEKQKHLVRIDNLNGKWIELFEELNKRFPDDVTLVSKMHSNVSYLVPYDWLHLEINPFKENRNDEFNQYPLICRRHYSDTPSDIKIDFRDDISVNLIGLKCKDLDYITDYCEKHSDMGHRMGLSAFVMDALRYYLKKLRAEESNNGSSM